LGNSGGGEECDSFMDRGGEQRMKALQSRKDAMHKGIAVQRGNAIPSWIAWGRERHMKMPQTGNV